MWRGVFN
ncbi:hypothetical protein VCHC41B1_2294A, partial [Vibrio cholerae HC-41B1]